MSISHYDRLPQGVQPNTPYWKYCLIDRNTGEVEQKLLVNRYVGRDPLTSRAYFDTTDLTSHFAALQRVRERYSSRKDWRHVELTVHADMLKIKALEAQTGLSVSGNGATGEKRGDIRGFSRASRKRMIEFMAQTRTRGQLIFATFTYPDEFPPESQWHAHFEALRRRIEREYPDASIIWRKELKERLSGVSKGKVAPHYHMIIDTGVSGVPDIRVDTAISYGKSYPKTTSTLSRSFEQWALKAWSEIVASNDPKHEHYGAFVVACRNKRHAYKYVSKYVAKEDHDEFSVGRRWGRIGNWDTSASGSLFLTKKEYIELMRLVTRWLKSKGNDYGKFLARMRRNVGCSLFGLGDLARSGDLWYRMLSHASEIAGEMPLSLSVINQIE